MIDRFPSFSSFIFSLSFQALSHALSAYKTYYELSDTFHFVYLYLSFSFAVLIWYFSSDYEGL